MTTPYQRESNHERKIKYSWEEKGYDVMRSAGSHGYADLIAWNNNEVVLIASQSVPFIKYRMQEIRANLKLPPNGKLLYYWKDARKEYVLDSKDLDDYCVRVFGSNNDDYIETQEELRLRYNI